MRKVIDYITVYESVSERLDVDVVEWLGHGYELHGSAYAGTEGGTLLIFQAMVKYDNP